MSIFNIGIISLKPRGLSYSFLNMPLIELILILIIFGAFSEIILFYEKSMFLYRLKRIGKRLILNFYKRPNDSFGASSVT